MEVKSKLRLGRNVKPIRRKRTRPVRKWKNSEITLLINYLTEHRDFEKPTQRIYYLDFIRQYDIDIPWDLIKGKVRNLRTKYVRLRDLYRSRDEGKNHEKTVRLIERSCPHFDKLAAIFEGKTTAPIKDEISWETDVSMSQNQIIEQDGIVNTSIDSTDILNSFDMAEDQFIQDTKTVLSLIPPVQVLNQQEPSETVIENSSEQIPEEYAPSPEINTFQDLQIQKLQFEKEKFCRCMALKEKKFEFKMESARKKFELKTIELELEKMKIEKDLDLEKMRLEINERITMKKLEMKQNELDAEI